MTYSYSGTSRSGVGGTITITLTWYEDNINSVANTSDVHASATVTNNLNTTIFDTYGNGNPVFRLVWHDNFTGTWATYETQVRALGAHQSVTIPTNISVTHASDGTLSGYFEAQWINSSGLIYVPATTYVSGGWVGLSIVPRKSVLTSFEMDTIQGIYSATYTRQSNAFREKLAIVIKDKVNIKFIENYVSGSEVHLNEDEWNILYNATKDLDKGKCNISLYLQTWTSDFKTLIGEEIRDKPFSVTDIPQIENVAITDEGAAKAYLPDTYSCMALLSNKRIAFKTSGMKMATIKSIAVRVGNTSRTYNNVNSVNDVFNSPTNTNSVISYSITVTDSRNNIATWSKSGTYYQYVRPSIINVNVARSGAESFNGTLSSNGEFWNGKVGSIANSVTTNISGAASGSSDINIDGSKWSTSKTIGGADPNKAYTYTVTITDSFGQSISRNVILAIEKPLMQWGKTQINVNGNIACEDYYLKSGQIGSETYMSLIDFLMPVGTVIANSSKSFNPNKLYKNTQWKQTAINRVLAGAGEEYPAKSTGGSKTHSHGSKGENGTLSAAIGAVNGNTATLGYQATQADAYNGMNWESYVVNGASSSAWYNHYTVNHGTKVYGETAKAESMPRYYAVYFWERIK